MENYPEATYHFGDNEYHPDGSVTVHCTLTVDGITRPMWLPVMDNRNKSVLQPDSRQISDAKMRCLVKAISMFGLASYIYAGEDLPEDNSTISEQQIQTLNNLIQETNSDVGRFCAMFKKEYVTEILLKDYDKAIAALNKKKEVMK